MRAFIKWTAVGAAVVTAASFVYAAVQIGRQKLDRGLQHAEQVTEDAKRALASTQEVLTHTQQTVRDLRTTISKS